MGFLINRVPVLPPKYRTIFSWVDIILKSTTKGVPPPQVGKKGGRVHHPEDPAGR